ncbi:FAB1C [Symbiodinium natans]|uniref:1-phosphatidylinositol-3-phosphate 5-kinase n=1 Tax=Symbiodinium natans TaxID=878477 RepID=A0A812QIB2_9DINO|nr:FAB1C [Symbiodinium natans]
MLGLRQGDLRWMPDEKCTKCFACGEPFSAWRRRHHCRLCGQIFCYDCSNNFVSGKLVGRPGEVKSRLCESCLEFCDESLIIQRSSASSGIAAGMQLFRRENRTSTEDEDTVEQEDVDDQPSISDGDEMPPVPEDLESLSYSPYGPDSEVTARSVWYWGDEPNSRGQRAPANHRAEVGLPEESIEHLSQSWEGLEDLEDLAACQCDAHGTEWANMVDANLRHFGSSVRECLLQAGEGLEDQEHLLTICKLAQQVVKQLRLEPSDSMDILTYVKVKKLPGGHIRDSRCHDGVVFSGDVVHQKMATDIADCPLTLIQLPLTFDYFNMKTDLDALREQERIYLDLKVEKIVKDVHPESPKLLLCQAVVSQLAQEKLRKQGIAVIIGVPEHILNAVARTAGCKVVPAVDSIRRTGEQIGGKARHFYVARIGHLGEAGAKSLTVIEGSKKGKFSTLVLRGGGHHPNHVDALRFLSKAKEVLQWAIRLARHMQLETELLFDLWCSHWKREISHAREGGQPEFENLDILYYLVNRDKSCSALYRCRCPPYRPDQNQSEEASGNDGDTVTMRDCTLREWLESCLKRPQAQMPAPSATAALSTEDAVLTANMNNIGSFFREGRGTDGASTEFPLPELGKVLCFQRLRSRVVVELLESNEERGRLRSMPGSPETGPSFTRSSLKQKPGEVLRVDSGSQLPVEDANASGTPSFERKPGDKEEPQLTLELWRYCRKCGCQVTPRSALSDLASWHSMSKFLDILLHNTTSEFSSLASKLLPTPPNTPCTHMPFRDHILFCGSPERPTLFLGFKWEAVLLWQLNSPHAPLWDSATGLFLPAPSSAEGQGKPSSEEQSFEGTAPIPAAPEQLNTVLVELEALQEHIAEFIRSVLICLSTIESEDKASSESPAEGSLPAPRSESHLRGAGRSKEAAINSSSPVPEDSVLSYDEEDTEAIDLANTRRWLIQNKTGWHRVMVNLNEFHEDLSKRLKAVNDSLRSRGALPPMKLGDPVLASTLCRNLMDSFREGPVAKKITQTCEDLTALQKLQSEGGEDKNKDAGFQVPLPAVLSSFVTTAKETYKRFWPREAQDMLPAKSPDPAEGVQSANIASSQRSRAKSAQDEERPAPLRRSRSVEARQKTPAGRMRRQDSETGPSALPNCLNQVTAAFTSAVESRNSQITTLPRCVHGISLSVHFEDVGSLIAYALLSEKASEQLSSQWSALWGKSHCPLADTHTECCMRSFPSCLSRRAPSGRPSPVVGRASNAEARLAPADSAMAALKAKAWKGPQEGPNAIRYTWEQDMDSAGLRTILNTPVLKEPVKVDFEDKQAKYQVAVHFAPHYHALRHWICGDDLNFVRSLQRCKSIQTSGGKSRATFLMSHDKRFLLKAINESEFKKLNSEAENLFWYFDKVLFDKWPSVLTQVIGLFSVSVTKKSQYKGYYVVQQNLRHSLRDTWAFTFDLKGTGKNRRVQATDLGEEADSRESPSGSRGPEDDSTERDRAAKVFWDQNFREWTKGKPLCLVPSDLTYLEAAIFNDTTLLSTRDLMDYSLLLAAVPPEPGASAGRLILGMIDYLRAFTIDKKVESAVKTALAPTPAEQPTIIAPKDYAARFMRAMSTYFVADCPEQP